MVQNLILFKINVINQFFIIIKNLTLKNHNFSHENYALIKKNIIFPSNFNFSFQSGLPIKVN